MGLNPLPKLEPHASNQPAEGENPFTLPTASAVPAPSAPAQKTNPVPEKPLPEPPPPKEGLGARLVRSLRTEPTPPSPEPAAPPKPDVREPSAPELSAAPAPQPQAPEALQTTPPAPQAGSRNSLVMIAAIAGAALGTASVLAVYLLMRPDPDTASKTTAASPFARENRTPVEPPAAPPSPAPAQKPAPRPPAAAAAAPDASRPAASFAAAPHMLEEPSPAAAPIPDSPRPSASFAAAPHSVVTGQEPDPTPAPAGDSAPAKPRKPATVSWTFEGLVFDLLTARGVPGAKLRFMDPDGNVVETDTDRGGRYKISLPARAGYKLKISHDDYTGRYIDEGDATSSLREATPEERRTLMSAAARNLPWTGDPKKPVHRDLALMPRTSEEP